MTSTQILLMSAELLGGLAFFLYGMSTLSDGLENVAGGALERTLKKVTQNQFLSFFLGAGITIAIQSSSAMTVMLIGLVNSGIVEFCDTFGMIMGSNVGTTLTAWLLSLTGISGDNFFLTLLKPMTFAPILAFVGILLRMVSKEDKKKNIGLILIGFAVLMTGMDFMSSSMGAVREMEGFQDLLFAFSSPMVALLISMLFTGIIQSSAATIGIVQALALTGSITYEMAIPLVLGANIGGIPELIKDGVTGELFESGNADELEKKIFSLWIDRERLNKYTGNCKEVCFDSACEYCQKLNEIYN